MKVKTIRSSWWEGYGYRLDCQPYLAGALETKILLERLSARKEPLHTLTAGHDGGIYNGPQFVRRYVDQPEYGVPFITGSSLQLADLSTLPLLSKQDAHSEKLAHLELKQGMCLISCSGTIGKMAYARSEMEGLWSSQDVLKIVAASEKILSGYLYAFLSSKFGIPMVASGTYGAIIQHIEPEHIANLPVPRLDLELERRIHAAVEEAADLRCKASSRISMARVKLIQFFGTPPTPLWGEKHPNRAGHQVGLSSIEKSGTLDPSFYNPVAVDLDRWIDAHSAGYAELGNIAQVFDVPPFKHIYVDADFGVGFFTSADIFLVDRKPDKYLSKSQTKGLEKYALRKGWVLLARSGSLGGNIARVQFADGALDGQTASDHVIRIVPTSDQFLPGYLYTFLSTESLGYPLLLRTATGACVPALWPNYLEKLRVLRPDSKLNEQLDQEVQEAFDMRVRATALEDSARNMIESELDRKAG